MGKGLLITMKLPDSFLKCMEKTLGNDFAEYFAEIYNEPFRGLRINTLKAEIGKVKDLLNIEMNQTPFCENGYYISNKIQGLGNNPLHHAGAIYLQEPSAMSAVSALDIKKGEFVLDLCAAPGGKSTQIADELKGTGLLWSNEYVLSRAKILMSNLERCGVKNAVISNASSEKISNALQGFFDKVLVDAPCSGEGMIRREPNAISEWNIDNREICAKRQLDILNSASLCLKSGGILVYSTCTLSGEENEMVIDKFLKQHSDFELEEINKNFGRNGYQWYSNNPNIKKCRRILYMDGGEGHFIAKLRYHGFQSNIVNTRVYQNYNNSILNAFYKQCFNDTYKNEEIINNNVYFLPDSMPQTKGIHILKAGIKAGEIIKTRFVPSHDLFMSKKQENINSVEEIDINDKKINDFLHGFEIECNKTGYTAVLVNGIICGFGKASNGKLKNHYPKGLRIK